MKLRTPAYALTYLEAAPESLEAYLLSGDLFWPLDASAPDAEGAYPALTLGNVLLFAARLRAREGALLPVEVSRLRMAEGRLDALRVRWRVAWEDKATREFRSRLRQWSRFLEEALGDSLGSMAYYAYEVRLRVILDLLCENGAVPEMDERDVLESLDARLKAVWVRGAFLWPDEFASGFPEERYWYLWGRLSG